MRTIVIVLFLVLCHKPALAQDISYEDNLESLYDRAYEHLYVNKDSCYFYFKQIEQAATEKKDWSNVIEALISANRNAGEFYDLKTLKNNLNILDSLFFRHKSYVDSLPEKRVLVNSFLYDKGNYYFKLGDFENARSSFFRIKDSLEVLPKSAMNGDLVDLLSAAYSFLAKMNTDEEQYELAKQFYNKNIRFLQKERPEDQETLNTNYGLLAEVYRKEKQYQKSIFQFKKALRYYLNKGTSSNGIISTSHNIALNYISIIQTDSAQKYIRFAENHLSENHYFNSQHHRIKAKLSAAQQDSTNAFKNLDMALYLDQIKRNQVKNGSTGIIYNEMGNTHYEFGNYKGAVQSYDFGLDQLQENNGNGMLRLKILKNKSITQNRLSSVDSYVSALETVDSGIETFDQLKPIISNVTDRLEIFQDAFPLFESGMEATYKLFIASENNHYIDRAFDYAEKSKSVLLLEAIMASKASEFATIPKDIIEHENQLKSKITNIEKKLAMSNSQNVSLEDDLFDLRQQHRSFVVDIETNYPTYFDLKYNDKSLSLPETQKKLTENEVFISYFYGSKNIYTIAISKYKKEMVRIALSPNLESNLTNLHTMLSNPKSNLDSLSILSHTVYNKLLAPIVNKFSQEKVIIIADGLLNYIPFGSLVTNSEQNRYLIEDRSVGYAHSATLWSQLNDKKQVKTDILAFAPSFDSDSIYHTSRSNTLGSLPHNGSEVEHVLNSFNGKSFVGNSATLRNFTSSVADYSIVHLATHAIFDDSNPEYSFLAFTPDSDKEDLLFVKDLYNLKLNTAMVTLSACESGIGELKRGEGFLSLARGFFYSGAASITSTLWKVNDNSSSILMGSFYENLAHGQTKDKALRAAKLSFIKKNYDNGLSHPYYWSGYTIQGNTQVLTKHTSWKWYLTLGIVLFLVFIGRKQLVQIFK